MLQKDEELALRVQAGDQESFRMLLERYEPKIRRYARRFLVDGDDIDDQVQETFIQAYTNIKGFNPSRPFSPWLYRIAHNQCVNALKKKKRFLLFSFFDSDTLFPQLVAKERSDGAILGAEVKKTLDACLDALEPKYREPLVLYYFEELTYKEIADVMRIPVSTVGVRISRGKQLAKKAAQQQTR